MAERLRQWTCTQRRESTTLTLDTLDQVYWDNVHMVILNFPTSCVWRTDEAVFSLHHLKNSKQRLWPSHGSPRTHVMRHSCALIANLCYNQCLWPSHGSPRTHTMRHSCALIANLCYNQCLWPSHGSPQTCDEALMCSDSQSLLQSMSMAITWVFTNM